MRALNVLLSVVVSLAIFLLVFEVGLRLVGMGPPARLNTFDPKLGWSKKADYSMTREGHAFTATFETNSLGLRDDPMDSPAKPAGTYRVAMIGDSFTLGFTVDREALFVDLLEDHWQAEGRPVDVLNVGTEAWSTDQEVRWLLEHGEAFEPDLVVLFPYENDVFWNGQPAYTSFRKPLFAPDGSLETPGDLEDTTGGWVRETALGRLALGNPAPPVFTTPGGRTVPGDFASLFADPPDVLGDAFERTRGALIALRDRCEELGAKLVVAPIPSNSAVDPDFAERFGSDVFGVSTAAWSPNKPVDFFLDTCAELGIDAVDARPALRAANASDDGPCYLDFFEKDREWHFNPYGNLVFAEFLYDELDDLAALPPAARGAGALALGDGGEDGGSDDLLGFLSPKEQKLFAGLWVLLTILYAVTYRDEPLWLPPVKVFLILSAVFLIFNGAFWLVGAVPAQQAKLVRFALIAVILGFVAWKLGNRLATIGELLAAFAMRGHWYLMPLVVVLLSIGSLLVVAASSPLVAPFIYTLF